MQLKDKKFQLFLLAYGNFEMGQLQSIIGATLPDLQCIFHVDLDEVSRLFLPLGLATGMSSALFTVLVKKCNIYLLMAIMMLFYSTGVAMVAITSTITAAHVALLVAGFTIGVVQNGTMLVCSWLFSENGYAFHVISFAMSAGSFLAPIIAEPFLGSNSAENETQFQMNKPTMNTLIDSGVHLSNISYNLSTPTDDYCENTVNFLYVIMGSLGLPLSLGFLILYLRNDCNVECDSISNDASTKIRSKYDYLLLTLIIVSFPSVYGLAYTYGSFLTTIGNEGTLHIGVQRAVILTSIFWLFFMLGRLASTAASFFTNQVVILYICLIGDVLGMIVIIASKTSEETFLWIGSLCLAFFSGPLFAGFLAWSRAYVTISPFFLAMCTLADDVGITLLPYLSGHLIHFYGVESQYYYCLGLTLLQLLIFCGLHVLVSVRFKITENESDEFEKMRIISNGVK